MQREQPQLFVCAAAPSSGLKLTAPQLQIGVSRPTPDVQFKPVPSPPWDTAGPEQSSTSPVWPRGSAEDNSQCQPRHFPASPAPTGDRVIGNGAGLVLNSSQEWRNKAPGVTQVTLNCLRIS